MCYSFLISLSWTGVRIGFDRAEYSVEESAGTVTLVAQVLSGRLSGSTVVRLITRDDTAQGMKSLLFGKP